MNAYVIGPRGASRGGVYGDEVTVAIQRAPSGLIVIELAQPRGDTLGVYMTLEEAVALAADLADHIRHG